MKLFFATTAALLMGAAPVEACGIYSPCSGYQNGMGNAHDVILDSILDSIGTSDIDRANDAAERRHRELMRELRRRRSY